MRFKGVKGVLGPRPNSHIKRVYEGEVRRLTSFGACLRKRRRGEGEMKGLELGGGSSLGEEESDLGRLLKVSVTHHPFLTQKPQICMNVESPLGHLIACCFCMCHWFLFVGCIVEFMLLYWYAFGMDFVCVGSPMVVYA